MNMNPYLPQKAEIIKVTEETSSDLDIKTYRLKLAKGFNIDFMPGQFLELSIPGVGEAPFGFASSPLEKDYIELSIKRMGVVTESLHSLSEGSCVWLRGPFGNTFPLQKMENSNILVVAGGLGLAPLRPMLLYMMAEQNHLIYPSIQMLLAARGSGDFIYRRDFPEWEKTEGVSIIQTIDRPEEGWKGKVGFPHNLVSEMEIDIEKTYAVLCGPPIMIKFVVESLAKLGLPSEKIYTSLEMRMTCGVGKCGKCNVGHQYVCIDGPVFSMAELSAMPAEY